MSTRTNRVYIHTHARNDICGRPLPGYTCQGNGRGYRTSSLPSTRGGDNDDYDAKRACARRAFFIKLFVLLRLCRPGRFIDIVVVSLRRRSFSSESAAVSNARARIWYASARTRRGRERNSREDNIVVKCERARARAW